MNIKILPIGVAASSCFGVTNRIRILRDLLKGDPALSLAATQKGFAKLVGCSMALIRGVENGVPISNKLAGKIEAVVGVDAQWILGKKNDSPIPAANGGTVTRDSIRQRVQQQIAENKEIFAKAAKVANLSDLPDNQIEARMLSKLLERCYMKSSDLGLEGEFMSDVMKVLQKWKKRMVDAQSDETEEGA